jgi:hypothetical protein
MSISKPAVWLAAFTVLRWRSSHTRFVTAPDWKSLGLIEKGPWIMAQKAGGAMQRVKPFTPGMRAEIDKELTDRFIAFVKEQKAAGNLSSSTSPSPSKRQKRAQTSKLIFNLGDLEFPKWESPEINPESEENLSNPKVTINQPQFTTNPPQIHHQKTIINHPFSPKPPAKTPNPPSEVSENGITKTKVFSQRRSTVTFERDHKPSAEESVEYDSGLDSGRDPGSSLVSTRVGRNNVDIDTGALRHLVDTVKDKLKP